MVFGIGEGKIDIIIDKTTFAKGETIKGRVVLKLNSPKQAKGLRIRLVEEKTSFQGGKQRVDHITLGEVTLGTEGNYASREYGFEMPVPDIGGQKLDGMLGTAVNVMSALGMAGSRSRFLLDASLDLNMAMDINKKVQINIV